MKSIARVLIAAAVLWQAGCSVQEDTSNPLVTDVDHTIVKRQSIGNCWIYAQASWLESLYLTAHGEEIDVSESYWTWWHWYDQILSARSIEELQTGGFWSTSANIILKRGFVLEGQFIPDEDGVEMSLRQAAAEEYINKQLASGGALATRQQRTAANVRTQLDIAFGTDMESTELVSQKADDVLVSLNAQGDTTTLAKALESWQVVSFPRLYGQNSRPSARQTERRNALMQRVLRALNDRQPVVMTMMVDFNALDTNDQTFKISTLEDNGGMGSQGGHMVVLEDYVVDNVPGHGFIGEGEVSDELKEKALEGDLVLLRAKNSWGTNRADRGLTDGYTRFDWDYLSSQLEWESSWGLGGTVWYTTLTDFVLPPGY